VGAPRLSKVVGVENTGGKEGWRLAMISGDNLTIGQIEGGN